MPALILLVAAIGTGFLVSSIATPRFASLLRGFHRRTHDSTPLAGSVPTGQSGAAQYGSAVSYDDGSNLAGDGRPPFTAVIVNEPHVRTSAPSNG